ncbi:ABC transporter permease [Rhodovulum sulfidophilum]|uniref:ABC transporter permease n=1 Tax=Rhodovulum sulfidophilum TaxID=35806 RepID=UPI001F401E06|nr:ABC transporter permease [Rhodovulum sulfidophilum]MCE8438730.1 ABC transporter permease [Rhodovulum sulfidophilum]MCE8469490.1 ABC transporter permease [Rhodovulum sulfidophilum]
MRSLLNTLRLMLKELRAIRRDRVMAVLILYVFTVATWMVANAASTEIRDLAVAVVDEDRSPLSHRLTDAIRPPLFQEAPVLSPEAAAAAQLEGRYVLVLSIPPDFERDLRSGHAPKLMLLVDATAMAQAGNGATFLQQLLSDELQDYADPGGDGTAPVDVVFRNRFNPNLTATWFTSVMQLMNNVTILTLILSGAAMIREREQGTIEHVLVMPVRPHEIVLSKILASGLVILLASVASLVTVIHWGLGVPLTNSLGLYVLGAAVYVVAVGSIGLLLATFTRNMGQFGLLVIPVIIVMLLLSGGVTPLESMPDWMQAVIRTVSPAPHFVAFAQSVLYRDAGFAQVAGELLRMAAMAALALGVVLVRFRKVLSG